MMVLNQLMSNLEFYLYNIIICFVLVSFFQIIFYFIRKYFSLNEVITSDEFSTLNHALTNIVSIYKVNIYDPKHKRLVRLYDLDIESQTNAKKAFSKEKTQLLNDSCADIIKNYLSKLILKKLYKYYSVNSIVVTIISILEEG
jgi:hypothetical protein